MTDDCWTRLLGVILMSEAQFRRVSRGLPHNASEAVRRAVRRRNAWERSLGWEQIPVAERAATFFRARLSRCAGTRSPGAPEPGGPGRPRR